ILSSCSVYSGRMRGFWHNSANAIRSMLKTLPRARNGAAIASIVVLIIALFVFLTGLILAEKKHGIEKGVEVLTSNFVGAVDQQVTASIDKIDLVLSALADDLQTQLATQGRVDTKAINASMTSQLQRIPELEGLRATDAAGIVIAGTGMNADVRMNFSDRSYFRAHRDG